MAECKNCRDNVTCIERRFFGGNQKNCAYFVDRNKYVEVVHAEWLDSYGSDRQGNVTYHSIDCTECGGVFKTITYQERNYWKERFLYCPFCGAKMDGGNEDG